MSKAIYITRAIHEKGILMLKEKGYELVVGDSADTPTQVEIIEAIKQKPYDAIVTLLTDTVDKKLFEACPSAKLFANYAVGYNNINLKDAKEFGVTITNTPGCAGRAVAEHTVALMLAVLTRIVEGDRYMRSGAYSGWQPELLVGNDLSGKVVGLIGVGDIGFQVAKILHHGFSCKIVYTDVKQNELLTNECGAVYMTKEEILKEADIISLHVPLLPSTTHLVDEKAISTMKQSAIIINTARGAVIDEIALVKALKEKRIHGAGVDVYEFEPYLPEGVTNLENIVMTPHIASARESVRIRMSEIVAENIISFFETGKAATPIVITE